MKPEFQRIDLMLRDNQEMLITQIKSEDPLDRLGVINLVWQCARETRGIPQERIDISGGGADGGPSFTPTEIKQFDLKLIEELYGEDERTRQYAEAVLSEFPRWIPGRVFVETIRALNDPDILVQMEAVWAISSVDIKVAIYALERAIQTRGKDDPRIRANIAYALGNTRTIKAIEPLRTLLHDESEDVRLAALTAIVQLHTQTEGEDRKEFGRVVIQPHVDTVQPDVLRELKKSSASVQLQAALTIAEIQNPGIISEIRESIVRGEPVSLQLQEQILGTDGFHADAAKDQFRKLTHMLGGFVSPEELQEMADIGAIIEIGEGKMMRIHSVVAEVVHSMNRKFFESLDLPPTNADILCAFTSNVDRMCLLPNSQVAQKVIDQAIVDAISEGDSLGKSKEEVIAEILQIVFEENPKNVPSKLSTKTQVIGCVLRMFNHAGSKKSIVDKEGYPESGKHLAEWIERTFHPTWDKLGGASGQIADFLAGIGAKNVTVYTQCHSDTQARVYNHATRFLRVVDGSFRTDTVTESTSIRPNDPTKINFPIECAPGIVVTVNGITIQAKPNADREIFTTEYYDAKGRAIDIEPLFEFSPAVLEQIGEQIQYFIINGPHYLQRYSEEKYNRVAPRLHAQLQTLKDAGVIIHFEFSGDTGRKTGAEEWTGLQYFTDVLRGTVLSMGINHTELLDVVRSIRDELDPSVEAIEGNDPYALYKNAIALATYLDLDRLHVHGHSVDIILRRSTTQEGLKVEQRADFHAKQRVVEWMLGQKSMYPTSKKKQQSPLLKRDGFVDLMYLSEQLANVSGLSGIEKMRYMRDVAVNGFEFPKENGYSVVIIPAKWIYDESAIVVTTNSGDLVSGAAVGYCQMHLLRR